MKSKKILIAEDSLGYRLYLQEIVENLGYDAVLVSNGKLAVERLEKEKDFDLVILDIEMPEMNGMDVARRIRNYFSMPTKRIPILGLTAHTDELIIKKLLVFGFTNWISKDRPVEDIEGMIKKYVTTDVDG